MFYFTFRKNTSCAGCIKFLSNMSRKLPENVIINQNGFWYLDKRYVACTFIKFLMKITDI